LFVDSVEFSMTMHGLANPKFEKVVPFEIYRQVTEVLGVLRV